MPCRFWQNPTRPPARFCVEQRVLLGCGSNGFRRSCPPTWHAELSDFIAQQCVWLGFLQESICDEQGSQNVGTDSKGDRWRNRIADLAANIAPVSFKNIIVRKTLDSGSFPGCQWSILQRVSISPPGEAVESSGDRGTYTVPFQTSEHVRPTALICIHSLVARKTEFFGDVLPSSALWHM